MQTIMIGTKPTQKVARRIFDRAKDLFPHSQAALFSPQRLNCTFALISTPKEVGVNSINKIIDAFHDEIPFTPTKLQLERLTVSGNDFPALLLTASGEQLKLMQELTDFCYQQLTCVRFKNEPEKRTFIPGVVIGSLHTDPRPDGRGIQQLPDLTPPIQLETNNITLYLQQRKETIALYTFPLSVGENISTAA